MKNYFLKSLLTVLITVMLPQLATAYDFMVNNIAYNIVSSSNSTVEIAPKSSSSPGNDGSINYSGNVVINENVYYSGKNYTVIGIGESAFKNSFINSIKLPETLTYIKKEAFNTCFDLTELSIPASVTEIGTSCFWMCPNLNKVNTYATTPPTCSGTNVFSYMQYNDATLYVPHGCLSKYQNAYGWKDFPHFEEMAPSLNGHDYVDLQLPSGKLWSTKNYGASSVTDYGTYVEWSSNDIVTSSWGSEWHTPTINDLKELINNCQWTWTSLNGTKGYEVRGNNGNTIFLPAAGIKMGAVMKVGEWCYYWSSTAESSNMTYILMCTQSSVWYGSQNTMAYLPIRPIASSPSTMVLATGISLNKTSLILEDNNSETLVATITPSNATNKTVAWSSSNNAVASVDQNGKVTANVAGNATITASTTDGTNLSATCQVTVVSSGQSINTIQVGNGSTMSETVPICNWWLNTYCGFEGIYLKDELNMNIGDKITSIAFYCASNGGNGGRFNVRMKDTNLDVFSNPQSAYDDISLMTTNDEVYGNVTLESYSSGNWVTFNLDKPFVYKGKNLVIDLRNSEPGVYSGSCYFYCTNIDDKSICWLQAQNEQASSFYSYDGGSGFHLEDVRPNIRITYIKSSYTNGDVNGDGHVSSVDVTALYNWLLNGDNSDIVNGDVDGDNHISSVDITAVYNILLGD